MFYSYFHIGARDQKRLETTVLDEIKALNKNKKLRNLDNTATYLSTNLDVISLSHVLL
jgi:hypothetical protein